MLLEQKKVFRGPRIRLSYELGLWGLWLHLCLADLRDSGAWNRCEFSEVGLSNHGPFHLCRYTLIFDQE